MDGIVSWLTSTGLRPYLDPLGEDGARRLSSRATRRCLAEAYPLQADGKVLLRFPRLFMVGSVTAQLAEIGEQPVDEPVRLIVPTKLERICWASQMPCMLMSVTV